MLCCYTQPDGGTATVAGYDIQTSPLMVRKQQAILTEHKPSYQAKMYVKEFLQFVASIHKIENKANRASVRSDRINRSWSRAKQIKI
ncbi:MAG: hypothetical protein IPN86_23960 [Saprospiraceae bacterium]|nr:hypothetical protein [Saprospiraceae bacterium]